MHNIVLVDDDQEILDIAASSFQAKGYRVQSFKQGEHAVAYLRDNHADCVILDVMMPGLTGFEVCEILRRTSSVPIIFLTGRISEEDTVKGLQLGADDYLEKPYRFRELEARVQAVIRRTQKAPPGILSFPPLEIDIVGHRALCDGEDLMLTPREYDILIYLATSDKDITTYEDIGKQIWGVYREQDRRSVMVIVSRLRKKMEINPITKRMILTVWSTGYRFAGKRADQSI